MEIRGNCGGQGLLRALARDVRRPVEYRVLCYSGNRLIQPAASKCRDAAGDAFDGALQKPGSCTISKGLVSRCALLFGLLCALPGGLQAEQCPPRVRPTLGRLGRIEGIPDLTNGGDGPGSADAGEHLGDGLLHTGDGFHAPGGIVSPPDALLPILRGAGIQRGIRPIPAPLGNGVGSQTAQGCDPLDSLADPHIHNIGDALHRAEQSGADSFRGIRKVPCRLLWRRRKNRHACQRACAGFGQNDPVTHRLRLCLLGNSAGKVTGGFFCMRFLCLLSLLQ